MNMTNQRYDTLTKQISPSSSTGKNCVIAFLSGGLICAAGEALRHLYMHAGLTEKTASVTVTLTVIVLSAIITGLNFYDNIAKHTGAGTFVPISGFANSVVSPAMEFRSEGFVLGVSAKMFTVAGPVIVFGVISSALYGLIIYIFNLA